MESLNPKLQRVGKDFALGDGRCGAFPRFKVPLSGVYKGYTGGLPTLGAPFWGPYNKDSRIWGLYSGRSMCVQI